jgi:hypothetical protein
MLVLSGLSPDQPGDNRRIVRSEDGQCVVWLGAVDDLWSLGKAVGRGGPWHKTAVKAGVASDPYLMAGYDRKRLALSHESTQGINIQVQVDITGTGVWHTYQTVDVAPGRVVSHVFPAAFNAYWIRLVASADSVVTAELEYN